MFNREFHKTAYYLVKLNLVKLPNMSNPLLTTTHSKLDNRVKEPSDVGLPTPDRFKYTNKTLIKVSFDCKKLCTI